MTEWIRDPNVTFAYEPGDVGAVERVQITIDAEGRPVYGHRWVKLPIWQWNPSTARYEKVDPIWFEEMRRHNRRAAPMRSAGRDRPVRR